MTDCPSIGALVEAEIDRIATQYRESPNLIGMMRAYLGQIEEAARTICAIPEFFDIDTAIGDQLTILGKRLGFPRCHCVCTIAPVFGFDCGGSYGGPYEIVGFCDGGTWLDCQDTGTSTICLDDDEIYRAVLKVRRYQARGLYGIGSLQAAIETLWGPTATVHSLGSGKVAVAPGRVLAPYEVTIVPVVMRAIPFAPGIHPMISYSSLTEAGEVAPIFGFGTGWAGFCEQAEWLCPVDVDIYTCS